MTPDRWQMVTALFDKAARLPLAQRDAFLVAACGADTAMLNEVRSLLEVHTDDPEYLEESALASHGDVLEEAIEAQTREDRVGPYQLIRKIGAGGMGSVYLAERADDEFRKQVAIKFIRGGAMRENAVKRFRRERQILARLEHPGIARLLDGGTTDKGTPYFVMEYVEGKLLLDYCDEMGMDTRSRLELFLRVCEAVEYAHERLIVHRDLKASNILVDQSGNPKLLDFGIAKVLQPDEDGQLTITQTGLRQFTPDYASPEQIRGDQVTTATDVYSLGVLLYEMLTGRRPFRFHGQSAVEILSTLLEADPIPPSVAVARRDEEDGKVIRPELVAWNRRSDIRQLTRALRGDLDNIILKALTKKPAGRYRTAAAFANDLRAYLDGHVVTARKATLGYRVRKFLGRHRWQTGMGAALALILVGALGVAIWQWRVARTERLRAEWHSLQSRNMARSLLVEMHKELRGVPGATNARRLLLQRATRYLDELAANSGNDAALRCELAESYRNLAEVQGREPDVEVGGHQVAIESYQKAIALAEAELEDRSMGPRAAAICMESMVGLSTFQQQLGLFQQQAASDERLEAMMGGVTERSTADGRLILGQARGHRRLGTVAVAGADLVGARKQFQRSKDLLESLLARQDAPVETAEEFPITLKLLGGLAKAEKRLEEALVFYTRALEGERSLVSKRPEDLELLDAVAGTQCELAHIHHLNKDHDQALSCYREALVIRESAVKARPQDLLQQAGLAHALAGLGAVYRDLGWFPQAVEVQERAMRLREDVHAREPGSITHELGLAHARASLAEALLHQARNEPSVPRRASVKQRSRDLMRQALAVYEKRLAQGELTEDHRDQPQALRRLMAILDGP